MARIHSIGLELQNGNTEFTGGSGAWNISSTIFKSGTRSVIFTGFTSGSRQETYYQYVSAAHSGAFFFRAYARFTTLPSASNQVIVINDNTNAALGAKVYVSIDNSGIFTLGDEDGTIGSSSAISTNTWYLLQLHYDKTAAGGSHIFKASIDNVEFASSTTRNLSAGSLYLHFGGNLAGEAQTTGSWLFDDIVINDSTGSFQNSYPGEGKIIHLRPNAAGDNADWTGDYTDIDEANPDDNTTKLSSNTLDQIEDVNIDSPTMIGNQDTINVVAVGCRFNGVGASANASFVLRIKASASGTVEESSAITPANTTWVSNAAAAPRNYSLTLYDLPGASTTAWTKNDLESAQIGVRLSATSTNAAQVSTLWALVDYTPVYGSHKAKPFKPKINWNI